MARTTKKTTKKGKAKKTTRSRKPLKKFAYRHVVKRAGHMEKFDERKVYASVYAAALATHHPEKKSEKIADDVSSRIKKWVESTEVVSANQIHHATLKLLSKHDKDIAMMYECHHTIC